MPSREWQQFFREFSKRGPLSCILVERTSSSDPEMLTIFWDELGFSPNTPEEALVLFRSNTAGILAVADDAQDPRVVNGVLNDRTEHAAWQARTLAKYKRKAGW